VAPDFSIVLPSLRQLCRPQKHDSTKESQWVTRTVGTSRCRTHLTQVILTVAPRSVHYEIESEGPLRKGDAVLRSGHLVSGNKVTRHRNYD
jgi:hypothetical protein